MKMNRRVFYFTDSRDFGGAEQSLLNLMRGIDRERWQPLLIHHPHPGIAPLIKEAQELAIETWPVPPMPEGWRGAARVPRFARQLRARRPEVFHAHLTWPRGCKFGLAAAVLARIPAIVATEQLFVETAPDKSAYFQQRFIARGVDRYIAVSGEVARRLDETFQIPLRKLVVIPNGIPVTAFSRPPSPTLRKTLTGPVERPIILTLARLDKQKGHPYLLRAAVQVPDALFLLAGDGPERAGLENLVQQLGIAGRVLFLGYRQDIADLLKICDMMVLPSLYEGLPLSILEAMAAGKPVIATNIGGTNEAVIDGQTGLLVPPADPPALAAAIRKLIENPLLAGKLAAAGKEQVQREFSVETMICRVTQVYDEILDATRGSNGRF
jgi:glycosyltransferase involved in cell wall biosynthesis